MSPVLAHAAERGSGPVDPVVILGLLVAAAAYALGRHRLGGSGQAPRPWRRAAFFGGLLVVAVALSAPLDPAAHDLFAAHMLQHVLLMLVAAPLLALGGPGLPLLLALPVPLRRRVGRLRGSRPGRRLRVLVAAPLLALALQTGALWGWHLPAVFGAALRSEPLHALEHLCLLGTAALFWWQLARIGPDRLTGGAAVLYVFVGGLPAAALGAVLTLAPEPLYSGQTAATAPLSPLADQQLAGLVMWVPSDVISLSVAAVLLLGWLRGLAPTDEVALPPGALVPLPPPGRDRGGLPEPTLSRVSP